MLFSKKLALRHLSVAVSAALKVFSFGTASLSTVACGSDKTAPQAAAVARGPVGAGVDDPQIPPQNGMDLETWLRTNAYKSWSHEPSVHAARSPSPHEPNQIFENDLLVGAADPANFPVGAAALKVLFGADMTTVIGQAIQVKVRAEPSQGSSWFWYQNGGSLSADGIGAAVCTGCHSGSNDMVFAASLR